MKPKKEGEITMTKTKMRQELKDLDMDDDLSMFDS